MTTPLDTILSGDRAPAPSPEEQQQATVTEQAAEQAKPEAQDQSTEGEHEGTKTVPLDALTAERAKSRRYTEEVSSLRQEIAERDKAWERRIAQLMEANRPQQQQEPPDFFANPEQAMQQFMRPVLQRIEGMSEAMSRQFAVRDHGADTVQQAYSSLEQRMASDPAAQGEYARIMRSGDPWGELVRWHKREQAMAEIGTDPDAYKAKVREQLLAELQNGGGQQQQAKPSATALPSNFAQARNVGARTGPAWAGPAPLADIFDRSRKKAS